MIGFEFRSDWFRIQVGANSGRGGGVPISRRTASGKMEKEANSSQTISERV